MNIYQTKELSESILKKFQPTRLAIKELAGIFYFCKSTKKDIEKYNGSGTLWKKHIKKHGKKNIRTLWISDWYYCPYEIQEVALHFSRENQIVESEKWANLKEENGLDGGECGPIGRKKTSEKLQGRVPTHVFLKSIIKHKFFHNSGIIEYCTNTEMSEKYNLDNSGLSQLRSGKLKSYLGWRINLEKHVHANTDLTKFTFKHDDGRIEKATRNEMIEKYNLSRGNLNSVIRGNRLKTKGWQITKE